MFTGIIQTIGKISKIESNDSNSYIIFKVEKFILDDIRIGDSISVNGVCLTVVSSNNTYMVFDVIKETLRVTNLDDIKVGSTVNLERSLKFGDEVGGHILSGHVSCKGKSKLIQHDGESELRIECPQEWLDFVFLKGYVAINGSSLTVAKKEESSFSVYLIPETLEATNLSEITKESFLLCAVYSAFNSDSLST